MVKLWTADITPVRESVMEGTADLVLGLEPGLVPVGKLVSVRLTLWARNMCQVNPLGLELLSPLTV